ncbi:ABC transporter substrate-binding protein [Companilactobacillus zhongbaensis]|uniref:ABC transporter substrate-binding protein n=1 Tax=Companilactobacillus zhongbaensis TaxID=2486009 RepID=UPI000F769058|nr:ABC transporter substrate-binding protein [Companilactobacillus zhongbaensis]
MKAIKKIGLLAVFLMALLVVTACGNSDSKDSNKSNDTKSSQQFKGQTMNVVATSDAYQPLFDKFSKKTGAKVKVLSMSSGEVLARMKADKSKPMADLWFGGGLDAFMQAKTDGQLEKYQSSSVKKIDSQYRDKDGYWLSKGLTVGGFVVNKKVLKEKNLPVPKTWADLADSKYKGEIIMSDPAVSGTMYAIVKGIIDQKGEKAGWEYWNKVNDNISFYGKRGKDPQEKTASGEFGIGIIPVDKMAFDSAKQNNLTVVYPKDGIPWVPEGVAVFKNAPGKKIAEAFIDFMLEPKNMKELAKLDGKDTDQIIMPGVKGLDLGLNKKDLIKENLSTFGSDRKAVLNKWSDMVGDK